MGGFFIRIVVVPLAGLICSRALLAVAHAFGWYPEQQLARLIMSSPTVLQVEWVQWVLIATATVLFWAVADYFVYQRKHAWLARSEKRVLPQRSAREPDEQSAPRATTVRTAFSQTQSIKVLPPSLGGNMTLRLDNAATLRLAAPYSMQMLTLVLDAAPVDLGVQTSPGVEVQGAQIYSHAGLSRYTFDVGPQKRQEITVTGRTFVVTLLEVKRPNVTGVANPIEYVFGISER